MAKIDKIVITRGVLREETEECPLEYKMHCRLNYNNPCDFKHNNKVPFWCPLRFDDKGVTITVEQDHEV